MGMTTIKKPIILLFTLFVFFSSCDKVSKDQKMENWKAEIMVVEKEFNNMAQKEGLVKAFEFYAAEDGVIRRKNTIYKGKAAIAKWYKADVRPNETLTWEPTFIDVSESGDLAYTYGDFVFSYPDSTGNMKQNKGIFHTVWKRQADGTWRFVWD